MIDIQVIFDAGSTRDGKKLGISMLSNSLLAEGADGLDADAISNGFESLGAIYSSDVGHDTASLHLRSLTEKELLEKAISNFKKVLSSPDFPNDAIERIRSQTLIGIKAKQQSPGALAREAFMSALYQSHPYSKPSEGTETSIKAIKRSDIVSFYKKFYTTNNAMIAIVGAVDRETAESIAEGITGALQDGTKVDDLPAVEKLAKEQNIFIEYPSAQTHILVGRRALKEVIQIIFHYMLVIIFWVAEGWYQDYFPKLGKSVVYRTVHIAIFLQCYSRVLLLLASKQKRNKLTKRYLFC